MDSKLPPIESEKLGRHHQRSKEIANRLDSMTLVDRSLELYNVLNQEKTYPIFIAGQLTRQDEFDLKKALFEYFFVLPQDPQEHLIKTAWYEKNKVVLTEIKFNLQELIDNYDNLKRSEKTFAKDLFTYHVDYESGDLKQFFQLIRFDDQYLRENMLHSKKFKQIEEIMMLKINI